MRSLDTITATTGTKRSNLANSVLLELFPRFECLCAQVNGCRAAFFACRSRQNVLDSEQALGMHIRRFSYGLQSALLGKGTPGSE